MDANVLKGQWRQIKGAVQNYWGELTDDEVDQINGEWNKLVGKLQEKYGYTTDEAEAEVEDFMAEMEEQFGERS
jgi:uncharacterized protein YjbJ (UPF0337 family)